MTGLAVLRRGVEFIEDFIAVTMIVRMAAGAGFLQAFEVKILDGLAGIIGLVTVQAFRGLVRAVEWKTCQIMFEGVLFPIHLVMTGETLRTLELRTEVLLVLILVTSQTLLALKARPNIFDVVFAFGNVTGLTALLGVGTDQDKTRFFPVIELLNVFPGLGHVTAGAILAFELRRLEEVDIVFRVTAYAGPALFAEELGFILAGHLLAAFFRMAARAFRSRVSPIEKESRAGVIEVLLIERVDGRVSTFVLFVAVDTGLAVHQTVEVFLRFHLGVDILMAIQTVFVRNAASRLMAFQAIFMFEILMTGDERSRR